MFVAGYGGGFQSFMEEQVLPPFEKANNVKITYVAGRSSETVAKLQAQQGNQEMNVVIVDDGPMFQAVQFGYCAPVEDAPVYADIHDFAKPEIYDGKAIGIGLVATGITYNAETFEANGWDVPTSWNDLTDPKFVQRFAASPIGGTYGLHTLVMFARMNGGSETDIQPGFEAIKAKLVPNVLSWTSSNDQLAQMFQNKDIDIAVWGSARAADLQKSGVPVEFVYPEEGAPTLAVTACAVVDNSLPEQSQALLQYLVSDKVQVMLASYGYGPTNSMTKVDDDVAAHLPYGKEKLQSS
ncbi:extracellular solute-binding protein, family 1 [Roseobacter sp. GAI101]|nr:extracellular solute-binding protein, family 1 [Roseobacter sp. GAI101]